MHGARILHGLSCRRSNSSSTASRGPTFFERNPHYFQPGHYPAREKYITRPLFLRRKYQERGLDLGSLLSFGRRRTQQTAHQGRSLVVCILHQSRVVVSPQASRFRPTTGTPPTQPCDRLGAPGLFSIRSSLLPFLFRNASATLYVYEH